MVTNSQLLPLEEKEEKLKKFAHHILHHSKHSENLLNLLSELSLTAKKVIDDYIYFDMDIFAYGNEIFDPLSMRMVLHMHNLLEGSWHQERQRLINHFIVKLNPKTIVDVGFGGPSHYVKNGFCQS